MAKRMGDVPRGILAVISFVALSITVAEFEEVASTKSCGLNAESLVSAGLAAGNASEISATARRRRPPLQAALAVMGRKSRPLNPIKSFFIFFNIEIYGSRSRERGRDSSGRRSTVASSGLGAVEN
jgi:hypothetical protein